jgi:hypothetical protein
MAWVIDGSTVAFNGIYQMSGASTFRLISDQVASSIVAAAEAAAASAAAYASFIRNNWVVCSPFIGTGAAANYALSIDPGSVNNMFPIVGGVAQMISDGSYSLVYVTGSPFININVPTGIVFEVRIGNAVAVTTSSAGSVAGTSMYPRWAMQPFRTSPSALLC